MWLHAAAGQTLVLFRTFTAAWIQEWQTSATPGVSPEQLRALQKLFAAKVTTTLPGGNSTCETVFTSTRPGGNSTCETVFTSASSHTPLALQVHMRIRGGWGELCTLRCKRHF